jgi:uncharacterized protein YndB with AHSA1/START domain
MTPEAKPAIAVKRTLHVEVPVEKAFQVFTEKMGSWWPATHHVGGTPFKEIVMEKRVGGRWYEVNIEGVEGDWGHVLAWEPPKRVALSWHLQPGLSTPTLRVPAKSRSILFPKALQPPALNSCTATSNATVKVTTKCAKRSIRLAAGQPCSKLM